MTAKNNPKTLWAWCMYDWANSAYSLTITSAIFPLYFLSIAVSEGKDKNTIDFLFWSGMSNSAVYAFIVSFSALLIAFVNPLAGSLADAMGKQKTFMRAFCYLGVFCCGLLFFATKEYLNLTIIAFILSSVAYSCSIVFCNAILPVIATSDKFDSVSARGFALGYIGGVLMLGLNILMSQKPEWFFFSKSMIAQDIHIRISFLLVGVWWLVFAEYAFAYLPNGTSGTSSNLAKKSIFIQGYAELIKAGKVVFRQARLRTFLISFFFYNTGLMTIMQVATIFGKVEVGLSQSTLIQIVLLLQLVGAIGALAFSALSQKIGNVRTLQIGVFLWVFICLYAYTVYTEASFYILAVWVGLVMGGLQALSRATYAKILPTDTKDTASFFSFYDTTDKVGTVLGAFVYGFIETLTGTMRNSILALGSFFLIGLIGLLILQTLKDKKEVL